MQNENKEVDILIKNLSEAILENKKKPLKLGGDPFDFYVERVQSSFFKNEKLFSIRFLNGFHILTE